MAQANRDYIGSKLLDGICALMKAPRHKSNSRLIKSGFESIVVGYLALTGHERLATDKQLRALWRMDVEKARTWLKGYFPQEEDAEQTQ